MPEFDATEFIRQLETHGAPPDPRTGLDTASLVHDDPALADVEVTDACAAGPHGPVPVRLYIDPSRGARSGLVWVHGGAFIGGDLDMPEAHWVSLYLASRGVAVASVDYHKALRGTRYPVPLDDVAAAWSWVTGPDHPLGDAVSMYHFGGASAGANLSTGVTQQLRDRGADLPQSLILVYPLVHARLPPLADDIMTALAKSPPPINFTPEVVRVFNTNYAGEDRSAAPYAFPGDNALPGLPPVRIVNAEADELRSSGELFAQQLAAAGVAVTCQTQSGTQHGFLDIPRHPGALQTLDGVLTHIAAAE